MTRVRVIGCGNLDAGDDAVGLLAVREARPRLEAIDGVEVVEAGAAVNVVHVLDDVDVVLLVDAVLTPAGRRRPGALVEAEVGSDGLPTEIGSALSSHGLGLGEVVALAAVLQHLPRVIFVGLEAADVGLGRTVSPSVAAALPVLIERIVTLAHVTADVGP